MNKNCPRSISNFNVRLKYLNFSKIMQAISLFIEISLNDKVPEDRMTQMYADKSSCDLISTHILAL